MNRTRSTLVAGACAALLALAGASASMAQSTPAPSPAAATSPTPADQAARTPRQGHAQRRAMTPEQRQQMHERRAQAFKQKLALTADQEPAWNTFQQAMRPGQQHARLDMRGQEGGQQQLTTPERIDRMRAVRAQRAAEFDRRADAVKAFYATLRPEQQKAFDAEGARMFARFGHGPHGGHHGKHHGGRHAADGQPGQDGHPHHHGMRGGVQGQPAQPQPQ